MQPQRHTGTSAATSRRKWMVALSTLCAAASLQQTGCIQFVANMLHAVHGDNVKPEFDGLKDKRVAVITITDTSQYSDDISARMLTRYVSENLMAEIKDISLVREDEVEQWRDTRGFNDIDYVSLGRGLKADKVLSIEMTNLRLRDGQTMYRGHVDVTIAVHDSASGRVEFRRSLEDYTYPVTAALPVTETTEEKFRRIFLNMFAKRIARYFHPYDFRDSVAIDAEIVSQ